MERKLAGRDVQQMGTRMTKDVHPRRFARVRPTGRVSTNAKIIVGPRDPTIDCVLVDFSPGGACLDVGLKAVLPQRFELVHGNVRKRCRVVWKAGLGVGVTF